MPEGMTAAWQTGVRDDLKALSDAALAERLDAEDPGVALPQEGEAF